MTDAYCVWRGQKSAQFDLTPSYESEESKSLKDLCLYRPLMDVLRGLLGEEAAMQFNLVRWLSSERNWHMDTYLNPPFVGSYYLATWIALDKISQDAGPFEYIPGSHRLYSHLNQRRVLELMERERVHWNPAEGKPWPKESEKVLNGVIEQEIAAKGLPVERFLGGKGDVLIWHSNLIHRGGQPRTPGLLRKAVITHYCGINHRPDAISRKQHDNGCWYFCMNYPPRKNAVVT